MQKFVYNFLPQLIIIYISLFSWECRDSRFYIRQVVPTTTSVAANFPATCLWYQNYSQVPANLQCLLHHCSSPLTGESSYAPPPPENQLELVLSADINASLVPLGAYIGYSCRPGSYIESSETDPSRTQVFFVYSKIQISVIFSIGIFLKLKGFLKSPYFIIYLFIAFFN